MHLKGIQIEKDSIVETQVVTKLLQIAWGPRPICVVTVS